MMDEFQEKRNMVKMLLDMLKHSASDEVSAGMKKPEGMPEGKGLEIEKVSVVPHEMDKAEPMSPEEETLASHVMPKGEAEGSPEEEAAESPADEMHEDEEDAHLPPFMSLMSKKKIKK